LTAAGFLVDPAAVADIGRVSSGRTARVSTRETAAVDDSAVAAACRSA